MFHKVKQVMVMKIDLNFYENLVYIKDSGPEDRRQRHGTNDQETRKVRTEFRRWLSPDFRGKRHYVL